MILPHGQTKKSRIFQSFVRDMRLFPIIYKE